MAFLIAGSATGSEGLTAGTDAARGAAPIRGTTLARGTWSATRPGCSGLSFDLTRSMR